MASGNQKNAEGRWPLFLVGGLLFLIGLIQAAGGAQLLLLGGAWYYLFAGIGMLLAGVLIIFRQEIGAVLYMAVLLATCVWAYDEAGLNFWAQIPRLVGPIILGILVIIIWPLFYQAGARSALGRKTRMAASLGVLGLVWFFANMLQPQGVIQPDATLQAAPPVAPMTQTLEQQNDWRYYGRTPNGTRYSPDTEITADTISGLQVAWTFQTGDIAKDGAEDQNTPLQIGDTLYICTPHNKVFALNAETGEQRWAFDPKAQSPLWQRCRGVGYYEEANAAASQAVCSKKIILTTIDARLIALDAKTGLLCDNFGDHGTVDLKKGMGEVKPGYYFPTSAPTVVKDKIVIGGWVFDNRSTDEPSGVVRAFNVRTGALDWAWDLGAPDRTGTPGDGEIFTRDTPNVWSTPAFDEKLGLIYLPTGNSPPDFWGAQRSKESEKYSSSVVAVEIDSGKARWSFQTVHHDLWDYDVASQPALYDIPDGKGGTLPALIQTTKRGQIFLLNRETGKPLAQVLEKVAPQGGQEGDFLSPTQPYSVDMPSIGTEPLSEAKMWGMTFLDQLYCRIEFRKMRYQGEFTPPTTKRSLIYPGYYGGLLWGGVSIDETTGILFVNDMRMPQWLELVPREDVEKKGFAAGAHDGFAMQEGAPYGVWKNAFLSPLGVPCHQPPYGTMSAIDLKTRTLLWQRPMGSIEDSGPLGIKTGLHAPIGMPTLGGPLSTAGGLVFFAGTQDYYLRALDSKTGTEIWRARLPVGAQATPISYISPESGRQFIVISAGGARMTPDRGDYVIAYALPKKVETKPAQ